LLFITGYNGASDARKPSEAQYLIKKPFRLADLAEQVKDILSRHGREKITAPPGAAAAHCR
jgi:hypothetical protein